MSLSDFTMARWREWLTHTGYNETDAPYLWCLDAIAHHPHSADARSMKEFMEIWRIGFDAAHKQTLETEEYLNEGPR